MSILKCTNSLLYAKDGTQMSHMNKSFFHPLILRDFSHDLWIDSFSDSGFSSKSRTQ